MPGMIKRAGEIGAVVGLEWAALEAVMPNEVDRPRLLALLACWEGGMVTGFAKRPKPNAR